MIIKAKVWLFVRGSDGEAIMERIFRLPFVPSIGSSIVLFDGGNWPGTEVVRVIQYPLDDSFDTGTGEEDIHAEVELREESSSAYSLIEMVQAWEEGGFAVAENSIVPHGLREKFRKTKIDTEEKQK